MWLFIALIGYFVAAVVGILDKFILSKEKMAPVMFVFYSTVFLIPLALFIPFGVIFLKSPGDWLMAVLAGVSFAVGLYTMYVGFEESEISHIGPLVGAATPPFVFILARFFLQEQITAAELIAVVFLVIGSLIISFERSKLHNGWHRGMLWGVTSGFFFALSHVASKFIYNEVGFYSGLVWTRLALGLCSIFILLSPVAREKLFSRRKSSVVKNVESGSSGKLVVVAWDKILGIVAVVLVQYATALGSVSVVNALAGVQYVILIALIALLSRFFPRIFKEDYRRGEMVQELIAVACVAAGLAFLI